jgi:hypothetical protein
MQWPFIITAEQWSAAGTFWGGLAQVALVVVGALAGREWVRQERLKGVREIVEAHLTKTDSLLLALKMLRIPLGKQDLYGELSDRLNLLNTFDGILRELHFCAIRMYFYDKDLGDAMQHVNISLEAYRSQYMKYRDLVQKRIVLTPDSKISVPADAELVALDKELFTLESSLWESYIHEQIVLQRAAKKLLWGRAQD